MKIHLGTISHNGVFSPEEEELRDIKGPKSAFSFLIASLTGFLLLICPLLLLCQVFSYIAIPASLPQEPIMHTGNNWWGIPVTLLLFVPLHEFLHMIWHPGHGFSDQSVLVVWPSRLRFGVYFDGDMSRTRWIVMRLAPFVILSVIPACLLSIFQHVFEENAFRTSLEALMVVNGVGSGGDVIGTLLVLFQVPASARMCFRSGRAFWKPNSALQPAEFTPDLEGTLK